MAFYSFTAIAEHPVGIPNPVILLDTGSNVFTAHTEDIDGLLKLLVDEGVTVTQVNRLDDHVAVSLADLPILPDETPPLLLQLEANEEGTEADS